MRNIINKGERFRDKQGVISYGSGDSYGDIFTITKSGVKEINFTNSAGVGFRRPTSTVTGWIYYDYWREVE